jgi:hypothetical protein
MCWLNPDLREHSWLVVTLQNIASFETVPIEKADETDKRVLFGLSSESASSIGEHPLRKRHHWG